MLKCVFTAVEDFQDMLRTVRELKGRVRSRRDNDSDAQAAREFLDWLLDDNYIFQGTVKYRIGPDGLPDRLHESATGVFTDPELFPVVFPGLIEEVEAHLVPSAEDHRIVDIDYCNNASAIYHLEPIDDIVIREWDASAEAPGGDAPGRPLREGRLHAEVRRHPAAQGEAGVADGVQRGRGQVVRLPRDPQRLQPLPQARAVLRERGRRSRT